jgi:hypothetical protein
MITDFPEYLFEPPDHIKSVYSYKVNAGKQICKKKSIVFCGICRDVEDTIQRNILRIQRTGDLFNRHTGILYENDSKDNTVSIISNNISQDWTFISEHRNDKNYRSDLHNGKDPWHFNRCKILAECRNKYLEVLYSNYNDYDYMCVMDLDIKGGWSYDGICHGIFTLESHQNYACVSSYGVLSEPYGIDSLEEHNQTSYVMYDSLAFRPLSFTEGIHILRTPAFNKIVFRRGDDPVEVRSNFGGLSIYKIPLLNNHKYGAKEWKDGFVDPDHAILNQSIIDDGNKIILDPSMIVSYSQHALMETS